MARVKGGLNAKKKHNRVLKLAKGYRGARSKQYRVAKQSVMRALTSYSFLSCDAENAGSDDLPHFYGILAQNMYPVNVCI